MYQRASLAGLVAVLLSLVAATPAQALPRDFWGVQAFELPTVTEAALMQESGVDVARVQFDWRGIESEPPSPLFGTRTYSWEASDRWVGNLARNGITAHGLLIGSPAWLPTESNLHTPMKTAAGRTGWLLFSRAVAERYGSGGDFWVDNPQIPARPIEVLQIWNEQNSAARYKPRPDPGEYAELVRLAGRGIDAADPSIRVLLGGMFGTPQNIDDARGSMTAWSFLRRLYAVPGFKGAFDAVALHPYAPDLRGVRFQVRKIRKEMRRAGDGEKPLEITEIGWSSNRSRAFMLLVGPRDQARLLDEAFAMFLNRRKKWNIERVIWLAWKDVPDPPVACGFCKKMGLLDENLTPKLAHAAYTSFTLPAKEGRSKGRKGRRGSGSR